MPNVRPYLVALMASAASTEAFAFDASPSLPIAGAYFPFWLICAFGGIISAVVVRVVLIRAGVDDVLPFRLLVYVALAAALALVFARLFYGR
jgi:hypothetical protein